MYNLAEEDIINRVKEFDCNESLKQLVNMHSGILWNICQKNSLPYKATVNHSEMFANRYSIVFNACKQYKPERGVKFNTWVGNFCKWDCIRQINKLSEKEESNVENDELILTKDENFAHFDDEFNDISDYVSLLDDSEMIQVIKRRYEDGWIWSKIGEEMGYSHTYIMMLHTSATKILKKRMTNKIKQLQLA